MREIQNQREYHIILTKYEALHPAVISENILSETLIKISKQFVLVCIKKDQVTSFHNDYILEHSAAIALKYFIKYESKT